MNYVVSDAVDQRQLGKYVAQILAQMFWEIVGFSNPRDKACSGLDPNPGEYGLCGLACGFAESP